MEYTAVNTFCWNIRDEISILFINGLVEKQNLSKIEKKALKSLIKNQNVRVCVNDTEKSWTIKFGQK